VVSWLSHSFFLACAYFRGGVTASDYYPELGDSYNYDSDE